MADAFFAAIMRSASQRNTFVVKMSVEITKAIVTFVNKSKTANHRYIIFQNLREIDGYIRVHQIGIKTAIFLPRL